MSTVQGTDDLVVLRNGTHYRVPVSRMESLTGSDRLAVSRGGTDYYVPGDQLHTKLQGADFLAVGRGGVDYKASWTDVSLLGIPPVKISRIWMVPEASGRNRSTSRFHVEFESTGPHPAKPWNPYIALMQWRWYYEIRVGTAVVYVHGTLDLASTGEYKTWLWGTSDRLAETLQDQGSQVHFDYFLDWQRAYNSWIFGLRGEPFYWRNVQFQFPLSIPYRWNYHNLAVHPVGDQAPLQFASRFPTGTQVRMCMKAVNWTTSHATPLAASQWYDLPPLQ
jgi:hypothetical protein